MLQAKVAVTVSGQAEDLISRYTGPGDENYYLGSVYNTGSGVEAYLYSNVNGNFTLLDSTTVLATSGTLVLETEGNSLILSYNRTMLLSLDNTEISGPGGVGIRGNAGATVQDFSASAPTSRLPFSDNFSGTQLNSDNWTTKICCFSVANSKAVGATSYDLATVNGVNAPNVAVQATITLTTNEAAGLVVDYTGSGDGNYYFGSILATGTNSYQANIYRASDGTFTALATPTMTGSPDGTLLFEAYGSSLELFLSGTLVASANDTTLSGGSVGIRTNQGATLSAFSANALTLATPTLPFSDTFTTTSSPEPNQLTSNWINLIGNYQVNTSTGTATGSDSLNLATLTGLSVTNSMLQAKVAVTVSGQAEDLISRYTGPGDENYYLGSVYNTGSGVEAYLYSNVNGNFTLLDSTTVLATSGTLVLVTEGNSLSLSYNGTMLFSVENTAISGPGGVGIRGNAGATVQDFSASAPTSGLPFSDNFSGTQLNSANWTTQIGSFSVANSKAVGATSYDLATVNGVNAPNVAVQATITLTTNEAAGLVVDYTGSGDGNYYFGSILATGTNSYQANIYRASDGTFTALATPTMTGSPDGTLLFEVYGSSLELFLNGALVASANDTTLSGGSVGIRTNQGATLSTFSANALNLATPTLPFSDTFTTTSSPEPNQLTGNWINQVGNYKVNTSTGTANGIDALILA